MNWNNFFLFFSLKKEKCSSFWFIILLRMLSYKRSNLQLVFLWICWRWWQLLHDSFEFLRGNLYSYAIHSYEFEFFVYTRANLALIQLRTVENLNEDIVLNKLKFYVLHAWVLNCWKWKCMRADSFRLNLEGRKIISVLKIFGSL